MTKAIMYHYVRSPHPDLPHSRYLDREDFAKQLDYFASHFGFLSQTEFLTGIESRKPQPGVVLTFDDGFRDHIRYVLPCLLARGLWGIFYVPTGVLGGEHLLNVHRIHLLLGMRGGGVIAAALRELISDSMLSPDRVDEFRRLTYTRQRNDDETMFVKRALNYCIEQCYRDGIVDQLMRRFVSNEAQWHREYYMNPEELMQLRQAGMLVGSHSVTHPVLSTLSGADQKREVEMSFEALEAVVGPLAVKTFCHPYGGAHTFNAETEKLLNDVGCRFSFSVEPRDISAGDLPGRHQALPRYDCNCFPFGTCRESWEAP